MVLLLNGKVVEFHPSELKALLRDVPCATEAYKFQKRPTQMVETNKNLLFLHQREMGIITHQDPSVCFIGTDDITTCHFIILDCLNAGITGGAHLDGCGTEIFFDSFISHVQKALHKFNHMKKLAVSKTNSGPDNETISNDSSNQAQNQFEVSVFVIGGFIDDDGSSAKLSTEILMTMVNKYPEINFQLELFAVTDLNNTTKTGYNFPVVYGGLYNTRIHKLYPANFTRYAKEPEHVLRSTRFCCPQTIYNVYNTDGAFLNLADFEYKSHENRNYYLQLSQAPDSSLRRFSTSPRQERDDYESSLRTVFKFMYDHPDPQSSLYNGDTAMRYMCDPKSGEWHQIH